MSYRMKEITRKTAFGGVVAAAAMAFSWPLLVFFAYVTLAS